METRAKSLRSLVLSLDAVVVAASLLVAVGLHPLLRDLVPVLRTAPSWTTIARLTLLVLPSWLMLVAVFQLHRIYERPSTRWELIVGLLKLHAAGLVLVALLLFLTQIVVNRSLLLTFLASSFVLMYAQRALLGRWVRYQRNLGQAPDRLLLVGEPAAELTLFVRDAAAQPLPPRVLGYLSAAAPSAPAPCARLGAPEELERLLREDVVDAVVFFPPYVSPVRAAGLYAVCETLGVPTHFSIDLGPPNLATPRVVSLYERPFITYEVAPKNAAQMALKHGFDVALALLLLVVLAPLLLVTALAIAVTMGRPILFAQERAGLRGRRFRMLKFRSMQRDAEARQAALQPLNEMTGPVFKLSSDPRVTRLGSFLRRTSIDELPQLLNVLAGSMSLVGPRPLPVAEQQQIHGWHRRRLTMKPGLTGLWQVSGRNDVDFSEWMRLDLRYVDEWSLGLDAKLLLRTIPTVLFGRGSR